MNCDWELLDRQLSRLQPTPRGLNALAVVALFLPGMTAGALFFAGAGQPVQTGSEKWEDGPGFLLRFWKSNSLMSRADVAANAPDYKLATDLAGTWQFAQFNPFL